MIRQIRVRRGKRRVQLSVMRVRFPLFTAARSTIESSRFSLDARKSVGAGDNEQQEQQTHSFIVKIWLEETTREAGKARWRGSITHVPGGERQMVGTVAEIGNFVARYLTAMGVRVEMQRRIWQWLFHR